MTDLAENSTEACLNCGQPIYDNFCASCGQKNRTVKRPLFNLLSEVSHAVFELDGKAYRTVFFLFTKPGFLSREYIEGRRVSYTPPLRLFLVLSILLFFVISLNTFIEDLDSSLAVQNGEVSNGLDLDGLPSDVQAELESEIADGEGGGITEVTDGIEQIVFPFLDAETNANLVSFISSQVVTNYEENKDNPQGFLYGSLDYITFFMLLMMPLLAAILKVMYFFSKRYYVEHMILTLHNHTFLVLASLLGVLVGKLPDDGLPVLPEIAALISIVLTIWMIIYPFMSMKNYFDDGYLLTAVKFTVATTLYSILLAVGLAIFMVLFFIFS